jgi:arylsulfatase A-like enzyme
MKKPASITRRALLAGTGAPAILCRAQPRKRPNLLFLIADDHAAYIMGADGNSQALTPNLDSLAAQSTRFAAHYCNSPVCTPSRQSLLTGQMPHMAGVTQLRTALSNQKPTLARQLKQAGYQTAVFGKMHFNQPGQPGLHGFDLCQTEDVIVRRWREEVQAPPPPPEIQTQTLPWRPFQTPAREWLNAATAPFPRKDEHMRGSFIARQAQRYLEENKDRQFALLVSFHEPHSPFDFPLEDRGKFGPSSFQVPTVGKSDAWQIPKIFANLTPEEKQGIIAAYYSSAYFLDRNIGRVLQTLRSLGLEENTLVVYTADHGYCLGHHGRFEKHCGYDPALRVPLLIRDPRDGARKEVVTRLTEHIDLGPTLLRLLDAPPLAMQHGQDLRAGRAHIVSEYLENEEVYVRTERWKYIYGSGKRERLDGYVTENPTPGRYTRLFDLRADPGEFVDQTQRNPKLAANMAAIALQRFRETHPEREQEPSGVSVEDALDFYLRPRDNAPPAEGQAEAGGARGK